MLLPYLVSMYICLNVLGIPSIERKSNNKCIEEERQKITHVLAIKNGSGLEEESHIRTTIAVAAAAIYSLPFSFLLSVDGSVYFTFVKNKENINMTRKRKKKEEKTVCRSTHIYSLRVCVFACGE
jgi:hypothetical protein